MTRGHSLQYPGGHAPRDRPNIGDTTAELYNSGLCHSLNTLGTLNADRAYLKGPKNVWRRGLFSHGHIIVDQAMQWRSCHVFRLSITLSCKTQIN